ncbi:hypothetical protein LTR94_027129, partial [Friedmanniomyces endolithicus]
SRKEALRSAPYVVLDLRGNGGGSSHWSELIAQALWGDDWMAANGLPAIEAIEWRASEGNLKAIQTYYDEWTASGEAEYRLNWARRIIAGMTNARAVGEPYWRDGSEQDATAAIMPAPTAERLVTGPVYVITDSGCSSACLDAVDLWKAAGAIQVGRETSADTVYMDVRVANLPSDLAEIAIPMKIWRGRQRGNNEPQKPLYAFSGPMSDTQELRGWIKSLYQGDEGARDRSASQGAGS